MWLRIRDKGHEGLSGKCGDLILRVKVEADKHLRRNDFNIISEQKISVTQAILGGNIEVETILGKRILKISPGTTDGTELTIA